MTLRIEELRQHIQSTFSDITQVDSHVLRCTRQIDGSPFAVYYIDVSAALPASHVDLHTYMDKVIGQHYFDGHKNLQWSYYLYFVVPRTEAGTLAVRSAREWIEQDCVYARKRVISEDDVLSLCDSALVLPTARPEQNIVATWTSILSDVGVDAGSVLSASKPARVALMEFPCGDVAPSPICVPVTEPSALARQLLSLDLLRYRDYPKQRQFRFVDVNLIVGANGSGKTSLLEAIELLYCGRNRRNADLPCEYEIKATYAEGGHEVATPQRSVKLFRARNLAWYGQHELKTNTLCESFAQFSFLDTDAAVRLAESTDDIEDVLSRLLVGPEAARIWREVERTHEAVEARVRELRARVACIVEEAAQLDEHLGKADAHTQSSDAIFGRLMRMSAECGWSVDASDRQSAAQSILGALPELESTARRAVACTWLDPVSIRGLVDYASTTDTLAAAAEQRIAALERGSESERELSESVRRLRDDLALLAELQRLLEAGLLSRAAEIQRQDDKVTGHGSLLAGYDRVCITLLTKTYGSHSVRHCLIDAASASSAASKELADAEASHQMLMETKECCTRLAEQLRDVAGQLMRATNRRDDCPLCHTRFASDELVQRMGMGLDEHLAAQAQASFARVHESEEAVRHADAVVCAAQWLNRVCLAASISDTDSVNAVVSQLDGMRSALEQAQRRKAELVSETATLEGHGLSLTRMNDIIQQISASGYLLQECTPGAVDTWRGKVESDLSSSQQALNVAREDTKRVRREVEAALGVTDADVGGLAAKLSEIKERLAVARLLVSKLDAPLAFQWPKEKPLAALVVCAQSICEVAMQYIAATVMEKDAQTSFAKARARREQLAEQLPGFGTRLTRMEQVLNALVTILNEHSLTRAMEAALRINRQGMEAIFSRIHSPAEFSGLGDGLTRLVRRSDGEQVGLSQISTGQRAAFALSVFLAKNAQLRTAPPIMLMDDPIAHVDDLNALSFLDYLREVALDGQRQIFFATASARLGALFERKLAFLGQSRFCRFDLCR